MQHKDQGPYRSPFHRLGRHSKPRHSWLAGISDTSGRAEFLQPRRVGLSAGCLKGMSPLYLGLCASRLWPCNIWRLAWQYAGKSKQKLMVSHHIGSLISLEKKPRFCFNPRVAQQEVHQLTRPALHRTPNAFLKRLPSKTHRVRNKRSRGGSRHSWSLLGSVDMSYCTYTPKHNC